MEINHHEEVGNKMRELGSGQAIRLVDLPKLGRQPSCCGNTEEAGPAEKASQRELKCKTEEAKLIKQKVYENYQSGFHCAEAISRSVLEVFSDGGYAPLVKAASAFGGGIVGSTGELCGAFSGGVMALGYLLGRDNPGEDLRDCGSLVNEFKKKFKQRFGSLNCGTILDAFSAQENPIGCVGLTAEASVILADLLKDFQEEKGLNYQAYRSRPRDQVEIGHCPFQAGSCGC
jgi:C_GCAxxG_C_C family probable redox protein